MFSLDKEDTIGKKCYEVLSGSACKTDRLLNPLAGFQAAPSKSALTGVSAGLCKQASAWPIPKDKL